MSYSKTGFPLNIKSPNHMLYVLWRRGAHKTAVATHYNSEKAGDIHNFMWSLQQNGFIEIIHDTVVANNANETLFRCKINIKGVDRITSGIYKIVSAIVMLLTLVFSIIAVFI